MKTKEELICKYKSLLAYAVDKKDVRAMKIFASAEKYIFEEVARVHPELAESWISHLMSVEVYNYLSEKEATNIALKTVNQDGSKGFHWNYDVFKGAVEKINGRMEDKPFYNCYALYVVANSIYSDMAISISEDMGYKNPLEVPNEKMAKSCYRKAVEKLKDVDNMEYVRTYYKNKMYN